jgi:amidase
LILSLSIRDGIAIFKGETNMGSFKEYDQYDGIGLAELVRKKEVSPAEICEEAITRIERVNAALNAVITPMYDLAR